MDPYSHVVLRWIAQQTSPPTRNDIARATGISDGKVTMVLRELEAERLVTVTRRGNGSSSEVAVVDRQAMCQSALREAAQMFVVENRPPADYTTTGNGFLAVAEAAYLDVIRDMERLGTEPTPPGHDLADGWCVYVLRLEGHAVYVGRSVRVRHRLSQHRRGGKVFDDFTTYPCASKAAMDDLEAVLIHALAPPLNIAAPRRPAGRTR